MCNAIYILETTYYFGGYKTAKAEAWPLSQTLTFSNIREAYCAARRFARMSNGIARLSRKDRKPLTTFTAEPLFPMRTGRGKTRTSALIRA